MESASAIVDQMLAANPGSVELKLVREKLRALSGKPVELVNIHTPQNDVERLAYAEALLAEYKFKEAHEQMQQVIAHATAARQTFAVADLALMIHDLDSAESAYKKASAFAGSEERAKRGQSLVDKAR